jgi:hypothetical protein
MALRAKGALRQELIMLSQDSDAIVQALPPEEIYWTIKEVGADDCLPLISMCSPAQLEYILDLEGWRGYDCDGPNLLAWLGRIVESGDQQLENWLAAVEPDFLEFLLIKYSRIWVLDDKLDEDEADRLRAFYSPDGSYFFDFLGKDAEAVIKPIFAKLYDMRGSDVYPLLDNVMLLVGSEQEESVFKSRSNRLLDYGIPDFDEAIQIYSFIPDRHIPALPPRQPLSPKTFDADRSRLAVPSYPLRLIQENNRQSMFRQVIATLESETFLQEEISRELLNLTNKILVARATPITEAEDMRAAARRAENFISIGLEYLSQGDVTRAVQVLKKQWLHQLFQIGFSQTLKLKHQADRIRLKGWLRDIPRPGDILPEPYAAVFEGLCRKYPDRYDHKGEAETSGYDDFRRLAEIDDARRQLQIIESLGCFWQILFQPGQVPAAAPAELLQDAHDSGYQLDAIILTALANLVLGRKFVFTRLTPADAREFLHRIMVRSEPGAPWCLAETFLRDWAKWFLSMKEHIHLTPEALPWEIQVQCGMNYVRDCLDALRQELGQADLTRTLDQRYIRLLRLV